MKRTTTLIKTLLVAVGMMMGVSAWAASQTKIVLYSEDYSEYSTNNETVSDWTVRQNGTAIFDNAGGYAKLNSDDTKNRGFLYTSFGISDDIWTDAKWKGMTDYFIEFDFDYYHGNEASNSQFVVTSASTPNLGNTAYTGNERLFSFFTASSVVNESPATLYMNETSATGDKTMSITKEQACRYHVKLTVGASSVAYAVTKKSDESSVVSGSYKLESGVSNKVTGMWVALGKKWSRMMIDNIEVYYMASPIGNFSLASTGDYYIKDGDATGKYIRTTYDFTRYTYGTIKSGSDYVPSGFDESTGTRYQTTISDENKSVPSGLTFNKSTGENGYLQYYKNCGLQAGTAALTLSVTNATANTVSYLYYKQGDAGKTNTVAAASEESTPITISGTASVELPVKTSSYKLYTRLEVFTKDVTSTIGSLGYTTFASQYPLDCSNLPSGLNAYYVVSSNIEKANSIVKLTPVTEAVAAGTGLILKGTAGESYNIPVTTSGTDLSASNKMVGCTTATDITKSTENYDNFYVLVNGATEPEFQNLKNYLDNNDKVTIPAGKAYLNATGVDAARLSIIFDDDETTGVHNLDANDDLNNEVYDLQGRRVVQPQKGLYIVNGKKVVIK